MRTHPRNSAVRLRNACWALALVLVLVASAIPVDARRPPVPVDPEVRRPGVQLDAVARPAATFVVVNTNDEGPGTLRAAIDMANATVDADAIEFAIPGDPPFRIAPETTLPTITSPVAIDATTQPGYDGRPVVELDGSNLGQGNGLEIEAGASLVRGLAINRFPEHGIEITGQGGNVVEATFIGTDTTGTAARGNGGAGVFIGDAPANTIGATTPKGRNVVSGNSGEGVFLEGPGAARNRILSNYIGVDVSGLNGLGNGLVGVLVSNAPDNAIGSAGAGNVISANGYEGVGIEGERATGNRVCSNMIGTGADGLTALGNTFSGIAIEDGASGNLVGGTDALSANRLAYNRNDGVEVVSGRANAILGNSIFRNRGIGITLGERDVAENDTRDVDQGANDLQNYPVLTSAESSGATTRVFGAIDSTPGTRFRIELFASVECDQYGFGEGETILGAFDTTTDESGISRFETELPTGGEAGRFVTATATDEDGNTSEFSSCVRVNLSWQPPDVTSGEMAPPRNLTAQVDDGGDLGAGATASPAPRRALLGYNVYGATTQGQPPSQSTLLTSVPPSQTTANLPTAPSGSFFVVTAVYDTGESGPSNEVGAGEPPVIDSISVKNAKLVVKGSRFTTSVLVIVDGIPFVAAAKVKKQNTKLVQKGALLTGQTLAEYVANAPRRADGSIRVLIGFRNASGGVATVEYSVGAGRGTDP